MTEPNRVLRGRYRLERRLGSGGMGETYRARDLALDRPVAVKLLHAHLTAEPVFVERLRREARAVAALSHPNVVRAYDHGEHDGRPFLVMELVEGESLAELLRRRRALPVALALTIARDVLGALEHAHGRGLIHRDVKPGNVLVAGGPGGAAGFDGHGGPGGVVAKLADFGIAQALDDATITRTGEVLGSLHYVAPERLVGRPATPAADIYAVGVMLFQMLTGRLPFEGDLAAVVGARHRQRPPAPSALRPGVPHWLERVALTALASTPDDRYRSAAAMRAALDQGQAEAGDEPHDPYDAHDAPTTVLPAAPAPFPSNTDDGRPTTVVLAAAPAPPEAPHGAPAPAELTVPLAPAAAAAGVPATRPPAAAPVAGGQPRTPQPPRRTAPRPRRRWPPTRRPAAVAAAALVAAVAGLALLSARGLPGWLAADPAAAPAGRTATPAATATPGSAATPAGAALPATPGPAAAPTATGPPPTARPPTPPASVTPPAPAARAKGAIQELRALAQGASPRPRADMLEALGDIERALAGGDRRDAAKEVRDLQRKIQEMVRKGELDRRLADQLLARLARLV